MKLKLQQVVEGYQALLRVGSEKMNITLAYTLQRNIRQLEPDVRACDAKRIELAGKFGMLNEEKNIFEFGTPAGQKSFTKQYNELLAVEVDVDVRQIAMDEFNPTIAPLDLMALEWMFTETTSDADKPKRKRHK